MPSYFWVTNTSGIPGKGPAGTELVADVVISYNNNYAYVSIGGLPATAVQRTSHLESNSRPAGGNILFADSHVEWRNFNKMTNSFSSPRFQF